MKRLHGFVFALLAMVLSAPAWATNPNTYVSATTGADQGACPAQWPCQSFNYAESQTSSGGEVIAVASASTYAPVTITKAISILAAPGVFVGITPSSGDAITINAGTNDAVILRGLTINGQPGGVTGNGITFNTGAALHVQDTIVQRMAGDGINIEGPGQVFIYRSHFISNGFGAFVYNSGAQLSMDFVDLEDNVNGLSVQLGKASISNSVASGNGYGLGIAASSGAAEINVENCLVANNTTDGIIVNGASGIIRVSNSTVTDNFIGLNVVSGSILSRLNNTVEGNGSNGAFSGTYSAK